MAVVIPLHNLRAFVGEAIESVLAQDLSPEAVEIVVVDDGSTDGGGEIARRFGPRVRCLAQPNRGLSAARNAGIQATVAPLVHFLDADDRLTPTALGSLAAALDASPEAGVAYTGVQCIDAAGRALPQRGWPRAEGDVLAALVLGNLAPPHAMLVRRAVLERVGGFDEALGPAADWDLWLRVARAGVRWVHVARPLVEYRVRPGGMHRSAATMAAERVRVLDDVFADPALPAAAATLRPLAWQNVYLINAAEHFQAGASDEGVRWFQAAVEVRPALLDEPATLSTFCSWLLPMGYRTGTLLAGEWHHVLHVLCVALAATPGHGARHGRWTAWRTVLPYLRRRVRAAVLPGHSRRRLAEQRPRLAAFTAALETATEGSRVERAAH